jgi:hypothetical protein
MNVVGNNSDGWDPRYDLSAGMTSSRIARLHSSPALSYVGIVEHENVYV